MIKEIEIYQPILDKVIEDLHNNFDANDEDDPCDIRTAARKAVATKKKQLHEVRKPMVAKQKSGEQITEVTRAHAQKELSKLATDIGILDGLVALFTAWLKEPIHYNEWLSAIEELEKRGVSMRTSLIETISFESRVKLLLHCGKAGSESIQISLSDFAPLHTRKTSP